MTVRRSRFCFAALLVAAPLLASLVSSCRSTTLAVREQEPFFYPGATMIFAGEHPPLLDQFRTAGIYTQDLRSFCEDEAELGELLIDQFMNSETYAVSYRTSDDLADVSVFYESALNNDEWKKVRELRPVELNDCCGNWGGVFKKEKLTFKIHCHGNWDYGPTNETYVTPSQYVKIDLIFIDTKPQKVLGKGFLK
ncbi:MAG: hypothetical protein KJ626_13385 [Verrucomicrobia bacterium]|nr:hypothetical protein [Verrucomicrobiota bacterium]